MKFYIFEWKCNIRKNPIYLDDFQPVRQDRFFPNFENFLQFFIFFVFEISNGWFLIINQGYNYEISGIFSSLWIKSTKNADPNVMNWKPQFVKLKIIKMKNLILRIVFCTNRLSKHAKRRLAEIQQEISTELKLFRDT